MTPGTRFSCAAGTTITPQRASGTVVWDDGAAIHYRLDSDPGYVRQTPHERFAEITGAANAK